MKTINSDLLSLHGNPTAIQYRFLKSLENGGGGLITTANNTPARLIDMIATESSALTVDITDEFLGFFPNQIRSISDAFRHMSDYDYVGLFSQPSSTEIEMVFLLETLVASAVADETGDYNKVVIPRYSEFKISGMTFSNYYPIEIRLRAQSSKVSSSISVVYDVSTENPLHSVSDSKLEHQITQQVGQDILAIKIPVHQFKRTVTKSEIFVGAPFVKTIAYTGKFYAIRAYTDRAYTESSTIIKTTGNQAAEVIVDKYGKTWTELGQTLESDIYDIDNSVIPSVVVQPDVDNGTVRLAIPQIFLTEGRLGNNIMIELFTTEGEVEVVVDTANEVEASFAFASDDQLDKYHKALFRTENVHTYPLQEMVTGGTDGSTFETLRNQIIYSTPGTNVIVGTEELNNLVTSKDFTVSKFKDGLTDRIYLCSKELVLDGTNLPAGLLRTAIDISGDYSYPGVIKHSDNSCTLTPDAIYEYDETNQCVPLTADHPLHNLDNTRNADVIDLYNTNIYTYSPFHIQMDIIGNTPLAATYDFNSPSIKWITVSEDSDTPQHVSMYSGEASHDSENSQFILKMYVEEPAVADGDAFYMKLALPTSNGSITVEATELKRDTTSGATYFEFNLSTTYHVDSNYRVLINSGTAGYISLSSRVVCGLYWDRVGDSNVYSKYQFDLVLGERIDNLFNTVEVVTDGFEIQTYADDEYATYPSNVYARDLDGTIQCEVVGGIPVFNKLHSEGDVIFFDKSNVTITSENLADYVGAVCSDYTSVLQLPADDAGVSYNEWGIPGVYNISQPNKLHHKGDPILDSFGNPQYVSNNIRYFINMIHIGNKTKYQTRPDVSDETTVIEAVRAIIRSNATYVSGFSEQMLQNTEVYYQPKRSIGTALCTANTPYTENFNLEISIALRLHVVRHISTDEAEQQSIRDDIIELIDAMLLTGECSLGSLVKQILSQMVGIVYSVDILGINGDPDIQTVTPVDGEANLSLAHRLTVGEDQLLTTERALDLEFVSTKASDSVAS